MSKIRLDAVAYSSTRRCVNCHRTGYGMKNWGGGFCNFYVRYPKYHDVKTLGEGVKRRTFLASSFYCREGPASCCGRITEGKCVWCTLSTKVGGPEGRFGRNGCSRTFLVYLYIKFARIS
jgi:hypothetical protein